MILVYTQELDNAIYIAACLDGIKTPSGIIKLGDLELHKLQIKQDAENYGYIKGGINQEDAVFIWGSNVIRVAKPSDYGFISSESEGFFPPSLKYLYISENEAHAKRLIATLSQDENNLIYDASIGLGGKFIFSSLFSFANLANMNKQIHRVEIQSLTEEGIKSAFANPKGFEESEREILRNQTQQYIYYLANNNLPLLIPGQNAYPRTKDLSILKILVEKNDLIEEETAKEKYSISLKAITSTGSIVLKSKNAVFSKKEPAKEFVSRLPEKATLSIAKSTEYIKCDGPHSAASIMKAAQGAFHYPPQKTGIILEELCSKGLINSSSSNMRVLPSSMEGELREILTMLSGFPNIFPLKLKSCINHEFEPKILTDGRSCGIIPTKRRPSSSLSEAQRNIYSLIATEFIKTVLGRKIEEKTTAQLQTQGVTFTGISHKLKSPGFSILDGIKEQEINILSELENGCEVEIQYILEKKTGAPPKPFSEIDLFKKFTEGEGILYSQAELRAALDDLTSKKLILLKGKTILPTDSACQIVHGLTDYEGILNCGLLWEKALEKITDIQNISTEEAGNISISLIKNVKEQLREWLNQKLYKSGIQTSIPCPVCGKFLTSAIDSISCTHCGYKVSKCQYGKVLSLREIELLFKDKTTKIMNGFIGPQGETGRLYLTEDNKIMFTNKSEYICPICKDNLGYSKGNYICSCTFTIHKSYFSHTLTCDEIKALTKAGKTGILRDLKQNSKTFSGILYIDHSTKSVKCIALEDE